MNVLCSVPSSDHAERQLAAAELHLPDTDEKFIGHLRKTPGRWVENKAKANEDSCGTLVMVCQTTLASRAQFSRDIQ
jgi:hypothetical protein